MSMHREPPMLFALGASRDFGERVSQAMDIPLAEHEERAFDDGEHKARPLVNVRGRDVYVIQSLYTEPAQSVNDKLVRLLFFLGALRDASAAGLTAVVPYLAYARQDSKTQPRDPVATRYVAGLFESVGLERLLALEAHNLAAIQNAFRCRVDHLDVTALYVRYLVEQLRDEPVTIVAPDAGGVRRAERLRRALAQRLQRKVPLALLEKQREQHMTMGWLQGGVAQHTAIVVDDIIATGETIHHAAKACRSAGASRVWVMATHGLFVGNANRLLTAANVDRLIVTDSVSAFRLQEHSLRQTLTILPIAPLFAEAIRRLHGHGSLVELLQP